MENECILFNSRGFLKSCDFHSPNPHSSCSWDTQYLNDMIESGKMFDNMSIYVCTDALPYFVENILHNIQHDFVLVTGDSDATVPGGVIDLWGNPRPLSDEHCLQIANHSKLINWFVQNCILNHDKVIQIPIGLDYHTISNDHSKSWRGADEGTSPKDQEKLLMDIKEKSQPFFERINKIYVNFSTNLLDEKDQRTVAVNNTPSHLVERDLDFRIRSGVWKKYSEFSFVLSPYGGGLDCHRTWEALNMGCIPIVKPIGSNSLFEDLPVLIVNDWSEINDDLLTETIEIFKNKKFNYNKLNLSYWVNKLKNNEEKNPFVLDILDKQDYSNDDLNDVQNKLNLKKETVENLIKELYPNGDENYKISLDDMLNRCTKGVVQKLIDSENDVYPAKILYKIGNGGDKKNCFVCCTPLSNNRDSISKNIYQSLEKVGFNGYFYLFNGGFPNPSGIEMKYAAVPYCFKIFMMLEAKKLGFEKIIWLDSACYAVNNPQRLFDILETDDAIFRQFWPYTPGFLTYENTVFKDTIKILDETSRGNLVNSINVCTIVFGLNFAREKINKFVEHYYEMVKLGTPFLSYYPEEVVITSIFNRDELKYLFYNRGESNMLFIHEHNICSDFQRAKIHGYYFVQRSY
jgi:hypothetical protein